MWPMSSATQELNSWFVSAPRFPATPLALADALARAEHPLLRFFTAVRQPQKKEAPWAMAAMAAMAAMGSWDEPWDSRGENLEGFLFLFHLNQVVWVDVPLSHLWEWLKCPIETSPTKKGDSISTMHFGDVQDPQEIMQTPRKESLKAEKLCFFATEEQDSINTGVCCRSFEALKFGPFFCNSPYL